MLANWFRVAFGAQALLWSVVAHVVGWVVQIVSHKFIEGFVYLNHVNACIQNKTIHVYMYVCDGVLVCLYVGRAPAILDSATQALTLAPLFVWLEVLFWCGYRPQLYKELNQRIEKAIAQWKAEEAKKSR